jgi:hypothetical protein
MGYEAAPACLTSTRSRPEKLGIKPGMRVVTINVNDAEFQQEVRLAGAHVRSRATAGSDAIFFGADRPSDLSRLATLSRTLQPAGALWVIRRKGKDATISERESMAAGKKAGLVDVKVVSFSGTHTAEKYVIPVAKRGAAARPSAPAPRKPKSLLSPGRT